MSEEEDRDARIRPIEKSPSLGMRYGSPVKPLDFGRPNEIHQNPFDKFSQDFTKGVPKSLLSSDEEMNNRVAALSLSDRDLILMAGDATHQHYKGGLYKLVGKPLDWDSKEELRDPGNQPLIIIKHLWPHAKAYYVLTETEFNSKGPLGVDRFRKLKV